MTATAAVPDEVGFKIEEMEERRFERAESGAFGSGVAVRIPSATEKERLRE